LYVEAPPDTIIALDANDGHVRWKRAIEGMKDRLHQFVDIAFVTDEVLVCVSILDKEYHVINVATGDEMARGALTSRALSRSNFAPVGSKVIYFTKFPKGVAAFDIDQKKELWYLEKDFTWEPALWRGSVIVSNGATFDVIDVNTGVVTYHHEVTQSSMRVPICDKYDGFIRVGCKILGNRCCFVADEGTLHVVDLITKQETLYPTPFYRYVVGLVLDQNYAYCCACHAADEIAKVSLSDGHVVWRVEAPCGIRTNVIVTDNALFTAAGSRLAVLSLTDGSTLSAYETVDGKHIRSFCLAKNKLFATTDTDLLALDLSN